MMYVGGILQNFRFIFYVSCKPRLQTTKAYVLSITALQKNLFQINPHIIDITYICRLNDETGVKRGWFP